MVAPHEITVDLNVLLESATGTVQEGSKRARVPSVNSRHLPSPPSQADLGACLWGPPQESNAEEVSSAGDNPDSSGKRKGSRKRGKAPRGQKGHPKPKPDPKPALRPVSFAYVAQPGGKLWRVSLSDGEVDSTHCPAVAVDSTKKNKERSEGGDRAENDGDKYGVDAKGNGYLDSDQGSGGASPSAEPLELGQLRAAVDAGGAQVRGFSVLILLFSFVLSALDVVDVRLEYLG